MNITIHIVHNNSYALADMVACKSVFILHSNVMAAQYYKYKCKYKCISLGPVQFHVLRAMEFWCNGM